MTTQLTGSYSQHARLSPSDSKRWSQCTAAIAFQEANAHLVPKDSGSAWADEGTETHEWCAKVLLGQCTTEEVPETGMLGNDLRIHVEAYVEHCKSHVEGAVLSSISECCDEHAASEMLGLDPEPPDRVFFVEEQLALFYQPEQTGTADFIGIVAKGGVVERFIGRDYKNGAGVLVTSIESSQLAIYMFSAIKLLEGIYTFGPETIIDLAVFQPRHREGSAQPAWVLTLADLAAFCWDIEHHAIAAREGANRVREKIGSPGRDVGPDEILEAAPGLRFAPSEGDSGACRWCRLRAKCPKRLSAALEDLDTPQMSAEDMLAAMPDLSKPETKLPVEERVALTSERLGLSALGDDYLVTLYRRSKAITKFLDDVSDYLEGRLHDGEEVDGVKLVDGREGNRAWANEDAADAYLKQKLKQEERYTMKLKSPTQIEALLGDKLKATRTKNLFQSLITRSSPKRVIALADDKRPAVGSAISAMPDIEDEVFSPFDNTTCEVSMPDGSKREIPPLLLPEDEPSFE